MRTKRTIVAAALAPLALIACGKAAELKPAAGEALPDAPYGSRETPTATDLLTPTPQARPARSDELLKRSEKRQADEFDLPPE